MVFFGTLLIAEVSLNFRVDDAHSITAGPRLDRAESARPYRKIFVSYSHRDSAVVDQVAAYLQLFGDEYLRDGTHLRSGEVWSDRLAEMIQAADVFQLFWSTNSMTSTFVQQEWNYALSLNRPSFVRPVYWEEPLPARPDLDLPPEALRRLHFQLLAAAARARPAEVEPSLRGGPPTIESETAWPELAPAAPESDSDWRAGPPQSEPPPPAHAAGAETEVQEPPRRRRIRMILVGIGVAVAAVLASLLLDGLRVTHESPPPATTTTTTIASSAPPPVPPHRPNERSVG